MNNKIIKRAALLTCLSLSANATLADIINFHFTGRLTIVDPSANIITDPQSPDAIDEFGYQTAIGANLTYDTELGVGSTDLAFQATFWNEQVNISDISLNFLQGTNDIEGNMNVNWNNSDMSMHILWDATGLFNAIDQGLQAGDRISGTNLFRDFDGDGLAESYIANVNSATPLSDSLNLIDPWYALPYQLNQGPAPLATKVGTLGLLDGSFPGVQVHLDIGSGNSLYVDSISAVPVPAAAWLFGSGLIGLIGFARRKKN